MIRMLALLGLGFVSLNALAAPIPRFSVQVGDKWFESDRQVMIFIETNEPKSSNDRAYRNFERVKKSLKSQFPWREVMSIKAAEVNKFWDQYDRDMKYLGDFAITNVVMYSEITATLEEEELRDDGSIYPKHFHYSFGDRALYRSNANYPEVMTGDRMIEGDPDKPHPMDPPFAKLRSHMATGASVIVIENNSYRIPANGKDLGTREDFHQFYARLFGVRDGAVSLISERWTSLGYTYRNGFLNLATMAAAGGGLYLFLDHIGWNWSSAEGLLAILTAIFVNDYDFVKNRFMQRWMPGRFSLSQIKDGKVLDTSEETTRKLVQKLEAINGPLCGIALKGLLP